MRTNPLLAGVAVSILVLSSVGLAGVAGHLPRSKAEKSVDTSCSDCGVVVAIDGKDVVTLLGPAEAASNTNSQRFRVYVRMSDGSLRSVVSRTQPTWKPGDRVRLQNGKLAS
jgi:hypothetical protein